MSKPLILIPAWNEEAALPTVLTEIRAAVPQIDVLVIDDGSRDATSKVASEHGADVLTLSRNLGVGGAMRAGYRYAVRHGYTATIQVDADGQHDPTTIAAVLEPVVSGVADISIGARFAGVGDYRVSGPRWWAMRVLAFVISRVAKTQLTDTTSGFKASGPRAIALFATEYPAEYLGDTIEALVMAAKAGLNITQVPVAMRPRLGGEPSHSPLKAAVYLIRAFMALLVALTRKARKIS